MARRRRPDDPAEVAAEAGTEAAETAGDLAERLAHIGEGDGARSSRASSPRLPLRLRAAANRKAVPRQAPQPGTNLREAARSGVLTRGNTKAGTRGRQAVDAEIYSARQAAGARKGLGRGRASAGHEAPSTRARAMSTLLDSPPRWTVLDDVTRGEARRLARYDAMLSNLVQGDISPRAFRRRVGSWRPIRGERFLADPAAVMAILDMRRQAGEAVFIYEGRRS